MRRALAWVALAALAAVAVYGLFHEHLFDPNLWSEGGLQRFLYFTAAFWAAAGLFIALRPGWLLPVTAIAAFGYSTWWCAQFFEWWAPLAVLYFLGSSFLLGRLVSPKNSLLVGLAIWIFVISIVVRFPVNTRAVYAVAFAAPYLIAWRRVRLAWPALPWTRRTEAASLAVLLFVLLMHLLVALKPEVSSDGLAMHLTVPMAVARDARWTFDFERYSWALMPMGGDWAFTAAYVLGGEASARLLNFALLVVIAALIYQASRRWLEPAVALLASALFVSTPLVQLVTDSLFVENVWAAMLLGAGLALAGGDLILAGALFGAALSTKIGTTAFLIPAVIIAALRPKKNWRTAILALGALALFAAPPYVNAWWKTGNPAYPFLNNVFRSPYFDTAATATQDVRYREGITLTTPYTITFHSNDYFEGHNGALGFQYFLLLLPLLLLLNRKAPLALLAFGIAGAAITFASLSNLRYLYPALPFLSVGIAWLISEIPAMLVVVVAVTALNVWFFPASSWYHSDFALFRAKQVNEYLSVSAPERKLIDYLNRTAPGQPVAFFSGSPIAGLNARAYSDQWRTYEFWKRLRSARSPDEIAALFHELGIRYIITPVPVEAERPVIRYFVDQWTAPTGITSGRAAVLDVLPTRVTAAPPPKKTLGAGKYEDTEPDIDYSGGWTHGKFKQAGDGSVTFSNQPGDTLRLMFNGSSIIYVYTKAANRGTAQVSIDGREIAQINLYSRRTQWQAQTIFGDLGVGQHTLEIRVLNVKDAGSSDYFVDLDRLIVRP